MTPPPAATSHTQKMPSVTPLWPPKWALAAAEGEELRTGRILSRRRSQAQEYPGQV
jgi:hypothetical protein